MQFVQSGMLGALAALAVPIIVHLMFRRQARPIELGTLQFLKIVLRDNARRRRLKRWLLLSLRMAAVALIALLFARPFLLADEPTDADRPVVVLVDRSASLGLKGGTSPIDRALTEVRTLAGRAGRGVRLELAAFDREVAPVSRSSDLSKAITGPTAAGSDADAAMAWARDLLVRSKAKGKELHVFTDLQRSALGRGEAARIPFDVAVTLVDVGRPFVRNLGVTGLVSSPPSPRPRESVVITATVRNASPLPVESVPVRFHLESAGATSIDQERTIPLDGDATVGVDFAIPEIGEGVWRGHVEIGAEGDELSFDDRRYLAIEVAPAAPVLVIDGDPARSPLEAETYFLATALRLAPPGESYAKGPFDPRVVDLLEVRSGLPDLTRTKVVVLANVADFPETDAQTLAAFVDRGGGLVVFTGDRVTAEGSSSLDAAGLGVGRVVGSAAEPGRGWRLDRWEAEHPLLKPFSGAEHGDIRRPSFTAITRITPDLASRVLARFRGGDPALLERIVGKGRVVWFASGVDRTSGDWPRGRMFLPMVHRMVAYAAGLTEGGPIRAAIATRDRPPGFSDGEGYLRVANPDPFETETARVTPAEFAKRYGFRIAEAKAPALRPNATPGRDDRFRPDELWPWLALGLVGLLLLENFLANRSAA